MKKFTFGTILIVVFLFSANIKMLAQVTPDNWTGDFDIDTYQEATEIHGGSYSCMVVVNSGDQASCDLSSDVAIPVTAGDTYTLSFWAYTSDFVRITGVLDWSGGPSSTYSGIYVGPATGGWSQFTFSDVVPTGATGVNLRLRFYDVSGFTAPETQYVDDVEFESPSGTSLTVTNGGFESWPAASSITSAFAISETAVDVVYGAPVTSTNAGDFSLTGTTTITFSSAVIDGSDDQLVHLSGASANMTGDNILDNISDAANATDFDFYAGIMPISYTNTTNPSGIIDNTHLATYMGIISANDAYNNIWINDAADERNGVMIFDYNFDGLVNVGDEVLLTATRDVYSNLTELATPVLLSINSTGNSPYGPSIIDGSDIDENIAANTDPGEKWEGQLVTIENFTVDSYVDYDYYCSWSDGSTTYYFHVGDNVVYQLSGITMTVGNTYASITGVVDWYNSGPYFRINPRGQSDIVEGTSNTFIAGSFNGWNASDPDYLMTSGANNLLVLTKNLPSGDNEYKVVDNGDWFPADNQHIVLSAPEDITWKYNTDANLVSHTLPVVAGNFLSTLGGNDWDPTELIGQMEDPEGDDVYTLELTIPVAGNYECKVTLNNLWTQNTGTGGNVPFVSDGTNSTVFTYDFPNNTVTVSGPPPVMATITFVIDDSNGQNYDGFYLKGSWDGNGFYDPGWGGGMEHSMFYDDGTNGDVTAGDHIWTCQQQLAVDDGSNTWEWGVNDTDHNWVTGNWQFTLPDDTPQTLSGEIPTEPALIINEIMYNSPGGDEEWVEFYNNTDASIDLENWKLIDSDATHTPIIFPSGYSVAAGGYFTVEVATAGSFPFTPDYDGSGNFALNNTDDIVRLYNNNGILIDIVSYTDSDPWPTEPDGNGPTLSLIDPNTDNSLPQSWAASLQDIGTPGAENFPPIPFVDVTDPDGGEFLQQGESYTITWSYGFWDGDIEIEVVKEGEAPQSIVYNIPLSDGSFTWNVWGNIETGDDYKIIISGINEGDPVGESEDYFSIIEPYNIPNIVITEIMYNPPETGNDSLEFLEFFNNSMDTVDLGGFYMSQGIDYTFPNIEILPDSFLLLAIDSAAMMNTFGVSSRQWIGGALSNGGEAIELTDLYGNVVDYVQYDDYLPWDTLADGWGPSLTLCNPDANNSLAENWTHSVNLAAINEAGDSIWATPGFECQLSLFAGFTADKQVVVVGDSVMYTDLTVGDPTSWSWTFEGGTPETYEGQTPPYIVYDQPGFWNVTLVVSDGINMDSLTTQNYIYSGYKPVADFEADETTVLAGSFTNFTSLSTGDSLTFQWAFEGGTPNTSTEENPQEIYYLVNDWLTYDVTLIVTNPFGSDTLTKEDYIEVIPEGIVEGKLTDQNVNLFPNPTTGEFTISLPHLVDVNITVLDLTGKLIKEKAMNESGRLVLNDIENGIYLVRIMDQKSKSVVIKKLVIN